jgi:hypothetical protein
MIEEAAAAALTERQLRASWRALNGLTPVRRLPANAAAR